MKEDDELYSLPMANIAFFGLKNKKKKKKRTKKSVLSPAQCIKIARFKCAVKPLQ